MYGQAVKISHAKHELCIVNNHVYHRLFNPLNHCWPLESCRWMTDCLAFPYSSFEDDEPPCEEEIEYLDDSCPELSTDALNSEVNGDSSSTEEEGDEEERWEELRNALLYPDRAQCLISHLMDEASPAETLNINSRMCSNIGIVNGEHLLNG